MSADFKPTPVPSAFEVRDLIESLLGRPVEWTATSSIVDPIDGATVGAYVNDLGNIGAVILVDVPLTAWAGSAIALLPHVGAQHTVTTGLVTPAQFDNITEILNVAASMFNKPATQHLRLESTYAPRETLPPPVQKWALAPAGRLDGTLTIQGYGGGRISVVVAH